MLRKLVSSGVGETPGTCSAPQVRVQTVSPKPTATQPESAGIHRRPNPMPTSPSSTHAPVIGVAGKAPSLIGLLASKRLAKRLTNRYGRSNSLHTASRYSNNLNIQKEASYRMEPKTKFNAAQVEVIIKRVLDKHLSDFKYHPKFCSNLCKVISDDIKESVKRLRFDRYKVIAVVHIGEKRNQSMLVSSRCAWDVKQDDFASSSIETPSLFASASVFGVYAE